MSDDDDIPVSTPGDGGGDDEPFDSIGREPTQGEKNVPDEAEYRPSIVTVHWESGGTMQFKADVLEIQDGTLVGMSVEGAKVTRMMGMEAGVSHETSIQKIIPFTSVQHFDIRELDTETVEVVN